MNPKVQARDANYRIDLYSGKYSNTMVHNAQVASRRRFCILLDHVRHILDTKISSSTTQSLDSFVHSDVHEYHGVCESARTELAVVVAVVRTDLALKVPSCCYRHPSTCCRNHKLNHHPPSLPDIDPSWHLLSILERQICS